MSRWALIATVCLALIAVTRWPLVPTRHLYHIDNVNFALALDNFNPALHQPQPPGDPMYVALTRWLRPFAPSVEILFPLSGVLGSAAAVMALWWVGQMMFGARAGLLAALLLVFHPIFWLAGVGNYVRVYLALGAAVVAGLTWKSITASTPVPRVLYFCASAAALGLFAGFRPEMGLLLTPLILIPAWQRRTPWWQYLLAAASCAATTLPWLLITAQHSGGLAALYQLDSAYLAMQSGHSSLFYGATLAEALRMAGASIYWNLLGAIPWILFVPMAWAGLRDRREALQLRFLALWFVPPFLFYTFVHIHNPDHALVAIPAVSVAGAFVLTRLPSRRFWWAAVASLAASILLFFYPANPPFWASNYRIAEYTIRSADQVYAHIGLFERLGPVTVLWRDGYITPREIDYYFPHVPVLDLAADPPVIWLNGVTQPAPSGNDGVPIAPGRVLWLDSTAPSDTGFFAELREAIGGESGSEGSVHWANLPPGTTFRLAGHRFHAALKERVGNDTMSPTRP